MLEYPDINGTIIHHREKKKKNTSEERSKSSPQEGVYAFGLQMGRFIQFPALTLYWKHADKGIQLCFADD